MHRDQIEQYLRDVGEDLRGQGLVGEILLVGGAYMSLVLRAREVTRDVDAYFASEPQAIRAAASRVAERHGLPPSWLNDAVTGFIYSQPRATVWADLAGLGVYAPPPEHVFAMKALAGRPEDLRDLETLRQTLRLTSSDAARDLVKGFVPERLLTSRFQDTIETLFDPDD